MKIGLYFGSFNPVHIGHLIIAGYMVEFTDIEQIWFVVSPQNPLKKKQSLLDDYQRLEILNRAIKDSDKFRVSNIEFNLPKPSYTIDTLAYLFDKYPNYSFILIMGSDNLQSLDKWKNYEQILHYYKIYVYPRPGFDGGKFKNHPSVTFVPAPVMEISSSFIRESIKEGKDLRFFIPEQAYQYVREMNFFKK
jgi:nicotinate-nucleotide adenylyltransferase